MVKKQEITPSMGKSSKEVLKRNQQAARPKHDRKAVKKVLEKNQQAARPNTKGSK